MKVICMTTSKGGAAKSTDTAETAAALKILGYKVLVIDVDQTTGLTNNVGAYYEPSEREEYGIKTIFDVMTGNSSLEEAIIQCECFDLIPGDERLVNPQTVFNGEDDQFILKDITEMIKDLGYDYVFIDHGPQKDLLQKMAYIASDYFFITTLVAENDRKQAKIAMSEIKSLQNTRFKLVQGEIQGIILSRIDRTNLSVVAQEDMEEQAKAYEDENGVEVKTFTIPNSVAVGEAQTYKVPNTMSHKSSNAARAYYDIAEYIVSKSREE